VVFNVKRPDLGSNERKFGDKVKLKSEADKLRPRQNLKNQSRKTTGNGWWLSSVLRPRQHNIGHMEDDFYRSKDPTNSIKVPLAITSVE